MVLGTKSEEMNMKKNIILIDYENVQNIDLNPLINQDVKIYIFHGKEQKFTGPLLKTALEFGKEKFIPIEIAGNGKNAADFHIAYFLGKLSKEIENPFFHIISKDTGFKPLVHYIKDVEKKYCLQEAAISDIPLLKLIPEQNPKSHYQMVVDFLSTRKVGKPKMKNTLRNQIISVCKKEINEFDADMIIQQLITNNIINCKDEYISYVNK
jgi:PIN domain